MTTSGTRAAKKTRLAIVTNTLAPYRLPIYVRLAEIFETIVLHGGAELNRNWALEIPEHLKIRQVFTIQVPTRRETGVKGVFSRNSFHLNFGLLWWLPLFRPGTILTNELGVRTAICMVYGELMRVPVWVWWGGTIHSERNIGPFKKSIRSFLSRRIKRWISYGASSTDYLLSLNVPLADILQIQNCIKQETFLVDPPNSRRWFQDLPHPILLTVGQLIPRKGLDRLIESSARIASRGENFTLVIVGQGPEREALLQLAKQKGLKNFLILPNQSQEELNEIYKSAKVFLFPTNEDVWGLVANEALGAGLPVLCSKYAGCAGEIVTGPNIFDPLDPSDFDATVLRAVEEDILPPNRELLLTWQEVSQLIALSLDSGYPARQASGASGPIAQPQPLSTPETPSATLQHLTVS